MLLELSRVSFHWQDNRELCNAKKKKKCVPGIVQIQFQEFHPTKETINQHFPHLF